jgi:hypothetical protein
MMATKAKATTFVVGGSSDGLVTLTANVKAVVTAPRMLVLDSA